MLYALRQWPKRPARVIVLLWTVNPSHPRSRLGFKNLSNSNCHHATQRRGQTGKE